MPGPTLELKTNTDRRYIRSTDRSNRFILAEITAPHARETETDGARRRPPVNLAFVVDPTCGASWSAGPTKRRPSSARSSRRSRSPPWGGGALAATGLRGRARTGRRSGKLPHRVVAPTGFEPVFQSRSRFRQLGEPLTTQSNSNTRRD
jgi:hypothetical protein